MAVIDFFDKGWAINPTGAAFVMDDTVWTFDEARKMSCRIANALLATKLPKESKVAVWSLNDPVAWICVLAIWRAGMTWVPINPRSSLEDNAHILSAFDCQVLFFQKGFADLVTSFADGASKLEHTICLEEAVKGAPSLDEFVSGQASTPTAIDYDMDDVVMLGPTGGTTGMPKGVMNTHRNLQTFVAQYSMATTYRPGEPVVNLAATPASSSNLPTRCWTWTTPTWVLS
ncbi:MAG: acyl-CoA synthetase (AMP-forming)/AMP-acid ligase II [Alphaproteobacteria bacterium]|jgi:acyl-CoA synthetase (AMP-forming)/AMP-acid ligase II